jgi:succinate dehydrogenase / fumarate reductase flavoprotein subunit
LKAAPRKVGISGNREYNPGWHTALDLTICSRYRRPSRWRRWSARKAAAAHFRDDYPEKDRAYGPSQFA